MLVSFTVQNHRSIADEQTLQLGAGRSSGLATVAAIYGANASGKTNVLNALVWMRRP